MAPRRIVALIAFLLVAGAPAAQASVIVTAVESGGDVIISGGGTLNLGAWTAPAEPDGDFGRINPSSGDVVVGPITGPTSVLRYTDPVNLMGPDSFGTGGDTTADFGTGAGVFGFIVTFMEPSAPNGQLLVPVDYLSGDPLSGSSTYSGQTLASLGMNLGSYTWSWGSGGTADSFTMNVVPEPSTAALMTLGLVGLAARRRRA
jgi:hypothetical protein